MEGTEADEWLSSLDTSKCRSCGISKTPFICICQSVGYCSKLCQRTHWPVHKKHCATIPLWLASVAGNLSSLQDALTRPKIQINLVVPVFGFTAVSICTSKGFGECLALLIKHGAIINNPSTRGFTPIHLACLEDRDDCLKLLVESGAGMNVYSENEYHTTPAAICSTKGHLACLQICLDNGADPSLVTVNNNTAVHGACQFGHVKCLQLLIRRGAVLELNRHATYPSPIDYALLFGHYDCIGLLLAEGGYFNAGESVVPLSLFLEVFIYSLLLTPLSFSTDPYEFSECVPDGTKVL